MMDHDATETANQHTPALQSVSVLPFDYNVDNFFADMESISVLCGEAGQDSFEGKEIERFSSMITFLKEWKQFQYEPKTIRFACETESGQVKDAIDGISLSQFSSATVPKVEQLPNETRSLDSDFVLNAGGLVWALDWCPRIHEKLDCDIKCEYLAVAAHPPGSMYHNIGIPLVGRGVIQIWSLLNLEDKVEEKVEYIPTRSKLRGRPKKIPVKEEPALDLKSKELSTTPRPRGRPRKRPVMSVDDKDGLKESSSAKPRGRPRKIPIITSNDEKESSPARPRGRPRKTLLPNVNDLNRDIETPLSCKNLIRRADDYTPPLNVESGGVALSMPVSVDLDDRANAFIPRGRGKPRKIPLRGRPRKIPLRGRPRKIQLPYVYDMNRNLESPSSSNNLILSGNQCVRPLNVDSGEVPGMPLSADSGDRAELFVPRGRGRPRKKPISNSPAFPLSGEIVALSENVTLPVSADLNGKVQSIFPNQRGRPSKKLVPSVSESIQVTEFMEDPSALDTSRGLESLCENVVALPVSGDLNRKVESFVPKLRGRPRKKPISSVNKGIPAPNVEHKENSSLPISGGFVGSSENGMALPVSATVHGQLESFVPRRRGRPRKAPIPHSDKCFLASDSEFRENSSGLCVSREFRTFCEDTVAERCQTNGAFAKKSSEDFSGRMIKAKSDSSTYLKKHIWKNKAKAVATDHNANQTIHTIDTNDLSITVSENCENADAIACQTDEGVTREMFDGFNGSELETKFSPTTCIQRRREKDNTRGFSYLESTNPNVLAITEHKESEITVLPTHDDHFQDEIVQSKEVDQKLPLIPKDSVMPRLVLCLAHNGKVAWDVKWRPSNINSSESKCHLGYLAVLLGNGSLEVWEVPLPRMVKLLYTSCLTESTDPRFMKLEPIFRCSKVKCGDRQSIPLTLEWSPAAPSDLILAGCHDGTVALWKFSTQHSSQDSKPLLCFSADSVPIRALAWAPAGSDAESGNLIVTAGHEGIKFWDIRDPYHPLWDFAAVKKVTLSLNWLKEPRCIIFSLDDGTLRILSLWKAACDVPVTGEPFSATKQLGLHCYPCSQFAVWSVHASRTTGLIAYCTADGFASHFQLTDNAVEKDSSRYRKPHYLCGSLIEEGQVLKINTSQPGVPLQMKKPLVELGETPPSFCHYPSSDRNQPRIANSLVPGDDHTPPVMKSTSEPKTNEKKVDTGETKDGMLKSTENKQDGLERDIMEFPPKILAMHRVRWNMNKGSERWLCYGGAAGIIRCQKISLVALQ